MEYGNYGHIHWYTKNSRFYWKLFRLARVHIETIQKSLQIFWKTSHKIKLIPTIPTVVHLPNLVHWIARYGTCRTFVYEFLANNQLSQFFELEHVLYIIGKVFSTRVRGTKERRDWFSRCGENREIRLGLWYHMENRSY